MKHQRRRFAAVSRATLCYHLGEIDRPFRGSAGSALPSPASRLGSRYDGAVVDTARLLGRN